MRPRELVGAHTKSYEGTETRAGRQPTTTDMPYSLPEENQPPNLTNRPRSKQTPGPDERNSSLDNRNGQTSHPGDITPHYAGVGDRRSLSPQEKTWPPG